jgi:hypothetical protein
MKTLLQGDVEHEVKVTFMKKVGYLVSVFTNGKKNQTGVAKARSEVGPLIRSMLRMEDKCGNYSKMAHSSRLRPGRKAAKNNSERC